MATNSACPNCGSRDTNPGVLHIGMGEVFCSEGCADEAAEETRPSEELQRLVLDFVVGQYAEGNTANLRELAEETGRDIERLARCEPELYPAVNCGSTPVMPWPWEREEAERLYGTWGVEPPDGIDAIEWVDD